jgi:AcrR family transcriptional regulator
MDDIASEAGLSRPSVYRYFADRNDLLIELNTRHAVAARPGTQIDLTDEQPLWPTDATGRRLPGLVKDVRFIEIAGGPHKIGRTHPGEVNKAFGSAA